MSITQEAKTLLTEAVAFAQQVETHGKGLKTIQQGIEQYPTHGVQSLRIEAQDLLKEGNASAEKLSELVGFINESAEKVLTLKPHDEDLLENTLSQIQAGHANLTAQFSSLEQESERKWTNFLQSSRSNAPAPQIAPNSTYLQRIEAGGNPLSAPKQR